MRTRAITGAAVLSVSLFTVPAAIAQDPPPPPKIWAVQASAGLAMTSGNTDTSTVNAAYDVTWDPQTRNVIKSDALFIRGKTDGLLTANRLNVNVRDEFRIDDGFFLFAQNQYLRDEFKRIDYLLAPGAGLGYAPVDSERMKLTVDAGVGGVWEKNTDADVRASGAFTVGEKLTRTLTTTTTLTQLFTGLWKTEDFDDALFTAGLAVAASMSTRTQLKFEVLNTFKNTPPVPGVQRNDVALLMAIVYKN